MSITPNLKINKIDALSVLAILAMVSICYLVLLHGEVVALREARTTVEAMENDLATASGTSVTMEKLEARTKASKARLAKFNSILPEEKEVSDFLVQLDDAARVSRVKISSVVPENPVPKELYSEVPVFIRAEADVPDLYQFLLSLSKMPRLTKVNDIRIDNPDGTGASEIELKLTIYTAKVVSQRTS